MKSIYCCDLHIGCRNNSQFLADMIESYFFDFFIPELEKNSVGEVVLLGDCLDNRTRISFKSLQLLYRIFQKMSEKCRVKILLGNHDIYLKNDLELSGTKELLGNLENIEIIDKLTFVEEEKCIYVPWVTSNSVSEIQTALQNVKNPEQWTIFGHLEISGFRLVGNHNSEHNSLDRKLLADFKHVYSGHYHSPQSRNNITYIGSPYQLTWNDYGDKKHVFIKENDKYIPLYTPEKYSLFSVLQYDDTVSLKNIDLVKYRQKYIRIYLPVSYNKQKFQRFYAQFHDATVPIKTNIIYAEHEKETITKISMQENDLEKLMFDYFEEYCKIEQVDENHRNYIKEKLATLYNQCIQEM